MYLPAISTDTVESHMVFGELSQEEGGLLGQQCILVEDNTGDISSTYYLVYDAAFHKTRPTYIIIDDEGKVIASIIKTRRWVETFSRW